MNRPGIRKGHLADNAELILAPGPCFFAGQFIMIGIGHDTAVQVHIIRPEKIMVALISEDGRHGFIILQVRQVLAFINGPMIERGAVMVRTEGHGVDKSGSLQIGKGRTIPKIIGRHGIRGIIHADSLIQIGPPWMQR